MSDQARTTDGGLQAAEGQPKLGSNFVTGNNTENQLTVLTGGTGT